MFRRLAASHGRLSSEKMKPERIEGLSLGHGGGQCLAERSPYLMWKRVVHAYCAQCSASISAINKRNEDEARRTNTKSVRLPCTDE